MGFITDTSRRISESAPDDPAGAEEHGTESKPSQKRYRGDTVPSPVSLPEVDHPSALRLIIDQPCPHFLTMKHQRTVIFYGRNPGIPLFFLGVHRNIPNCLNLTVFILYLQHKGHDLPCTGKPAFTGDLFLSPSDFACICHISTHTRCHFHFPLSVRSFSLTDNRKPDCHICDRPVYHLLFRKNRFL